MMQARRLQSTSFLEHRGPETRQELAQWDSWIVTALHGAGLAGPAHEFMKDGLVYYSDYSGMDFPKEAMRILTRCLSTSVQAEKPHDILHARCSDWSLLPQDVLKKESRWMHSGMTCVLGQVMDRMPKEGLAWVSAAAPGKDCRDPESANQQIAAWMEANKHWLFDKKVACYCHVHRRFCPAYPGQGLADPKEFGKIARATDEPPQAKAKPMQKRRRLARQDSGPSGSQLSPWYMNEKYLGLGDSRDKMTTAETGSNDEVEDTSGEVKPRRPLVFSMAGLTCVDYSSLGKQKRGGGHHACHHDWWRVEREMLAKLSLEDFYMTECADRYPAERLQQDFFKDTHEVHVVRCSPIDFGFPIRRKRTFTIGLNKATMVWTGPKDPHALQASFMELFHRTVELSGDVFFFADKAAVNNFLIERAEARKTVLPQNFENMPMADYLHILLARTALEGKVVYDTKRTELGGLGGAYLVDLEQTCQHGCSPGEVCPVLNTHSEIFSYESQRLAIDKEYWYMQGLDSDDSIAGVRGISPLMKCLQHLMNKEVRQLAGNGIHAPTWGAFWLWCMSYCQRREIPSASSSRPLAASQETEIDDGDQEVGGGGDPAAALMLAGFPKRGDIDIE